MTVRNFIAGHNRFSEEASVVLKKIVARKLLKLLFSLWLKLGNCSADLAFC